MGLAYHTELYLFVFLPLVVLVYHFSSQKMRRAVLILAGYLFFWFLQPVDGAISDRCFRTDLRRRALDGAPEGNWQSQG